jgi:hypothetical protein
MKYRYDDGDFRGAELWAPDFEDESTLAVLQKLLSEIGKQFDGDSSLHHIDIGYVGLWGEWHTSDTKPKIAMPSAEVQRRIIDMHFDAFPKTPKLMQLQGVPGLRYALQKGAGLRADCLADPSTFMMKLYPLTLLAAGAVDSWKESPVVFEICWKLEDWSKKGWNSEAIFTTALERYHASLINTKSADIPADIRPAFDRMLERIGYRFTIKELRHQKTVLSTAPLNLTLIIENSGVAPCYGDFRVAIRLRPKDGSGPEFMLPTEARLCKQGPGRFRLNAISTTAHTNIPSGKYDLGIGIVRGESSTPIVKLNNAGEKDGWYWLSSLHIY